MRTDPFAAPDPRLRIGEKLSYGAGEIASNVAWQMATAFLLYYYSDVALLPVAALGTLMLVSRIFDAVFDPTVGIVLDRTRSRFGKARPYLVLAPLPFALLCVATFSVPSVSPGMKVAYAYATFMALGLFYSFLYVPYSALLPMMTRNPAEKVQLGSFRAMGTSIGSMLVYATCLPLVGLIGGHNRQLGFTAAAAIMGAASLLLYIPVALNCRERFVDPPAIHSVSVARSLRQMIHNPVWRVVFVVTLLTFVRLGLLVSSLVYFAKDVLGKPWLISLLLPALSVCILAGGAIATPYLKRFGTRNGNMIVQAVSMFLLALAWLLQSHTALFITLFAASNIPGGIVGTTGFVLMADSVEMNQAKFGQRSEGLLSSSVIFTMKVGMAIGVAATAYVLGWVGYNPAHVSAAAQSAVTWLFYGGPLLLAAGAAIGISFYRGPKLG